MTRREQQLPPLIQSLVATWIERNEATPEGTLATVTRVEVSSGRAHARVYVSVLPDGTARTTIGKLRRYVPKIQQYVNKHIAIRPVPRISIEHDFEPSQSERIERLIQETKNESTN